MAKKKIKIIPYEDTAKWLCTFNDLMTLLLTFFVLLLSMSSLEAHSVRDMQESFLDALGVLEEGRVEEETIIEKVMNIDEIGKRQKVIRNIMVPKEESQEEEQITEGAPPPKAVRDYIYVKEEGREKVFKEEQYVFNQFQEIIDDEFIEPGLTIVKKKRGIVISFKDNILYGSGEVQVNERAYPLLNKVAEILRKVSFNIQVEGHTDSQPASSRKYPSNWELSVSRAVNVVEYLVEKGLVAPERIGVAGYGDSKPVDKRDTSENRSKNRRVEIVLLSN